MRQSPDIRKQQIFKAACDAAAEHGLANLTTRTIAESLGVSRSLVSTHYAIDALKDEIAQYAIEQERVEIVADMLLIRHHLAPSIPTSLRLLAINHITCKN